MSHPLKVSTFKGTYCPLPKKSPSSSTLLNKIPALVILKDNSIIYTHDLNAALPGDQVEIDCSVDENPDLEMSTYLKNLGYTQVYLGQGYNCKLIQRIEHKGIAGILQIKSPVIHGIGKNGGLYYKFRPLEPGYPDFIVLSRATANQYKNHVYAVINLNSWNEGQTYPHGSCEQILGEIGIYEHEIRARCFAHHLVFPTLKKPKLMEELKSLDLNLASKRLDLTDQYVFSIDPPGCRDVDDALHLEQLGEHHYRIGIHIADVSEYVKVNSAIDQSARIRTTSLYLPHQTLNMLPPELSEDLCSLLQDQVRLALSLLLEVDSEGQILKADFCPTRIQNRQQMTYDQAEKILNNPKKHVICTLYDLVEKMYKREPHALIYPLDLDGAPKAHFLIETCMVLANIHCAERLIQKYGNAILRVHPASETLLDLDNSLDPRLQYYLRQRLQQRAEYQTMIHLQQQNLKTNHSGLRAQYYTHFTSPIRRYIDLINHRLLKGDESQLSQLQEWAERCNQIGNRVKSLDRDLAYLKIVESLDQEQIILSYPVQFGENQIRVYLPQFKLCLSLVLWHPSLQHLYEVKQSPTQLTIKTKLDGTEKIYKLYQPLEIKVLPIMKASQFGRKLRIWIGDAICEDVD